MIRPAVLSDLDRIVELGLEFAEKSQAVHIMKPSVEKIRNVAKVAITDPNAVVIVWQRKEVEGLILGVVNVSFFSFDLILMELALYSRQPLAIPLLIKAFEKAAKEKKVSKIIMGSKPSFCDLGRIYNRCGYNLLEEHYIKAV